MASAGRLLADGSAHGRDSQRQRASTAHSSSRSARSTTACTAPTSSSASRTVANWLGRRGRSPSPRVRRV